MTYGAPVNSHSATPSKRVRGPIILGLLLSAAVACGGDPPPVADEHEEAAASAGRVTLSGDAMRTAGVETALVGAPTAGSQDGALVAPGAVELDPRRVALISSRLDGRLERLEVVAGDPVEAGAVVATLFSTSFLTAQDDLLLAERRVAQLAATSDSAGARALARSAARRLELMGMTAEDIARVRASGEVMDALPLRSPMRGNILESHTISGASVAAGGAIFTVADLSELDVVAEIPEPSLPLVRIGQRAVIEVAAYPGVRFSGTVERLHDVLNPETRTARAVLHVRNPDRTLRPGMFASVRLAVATSTAGARAHVIPSSAVVTDGESRIVFVEVGERMFERREVRIESLAPVGSMRPAGDQVRVTEGLRAGERIVIRGAFTLKSELAKASMGDSH